MAGDRPMTADFMRIEDLSKLGPEELADRFRARTMRFPRDVEDRVRKIIDDVARRGDGALIDYTRRYDGVKIDRGALRVNRDDLSEGAKGVGEEVSRALDVAIERVRAFHEREVIEDWVFTDSLGNRLGKKRFPLGRAGIYVPGGKASYPSTLVMTAVPAMVAGVKEIVLAAPPCSFDSPSPLAACALKLGGGGPDRSAMAGADNSAGVVEEILRVGGVQAIAAMALGTETVKRVDKIVGPGNIYVSTAKRLLYGHTDIDMIAGPSEVLVIADGSVDPRLAAADLMAQAEHDEHARALCVTWSPEHAREVKKALGELLGASPRAGIIERSLRGSGGVFVVKDEECALALANAVSPEHLEIQTARPEELLPGVRQAGAVFLGRRTAEAFGDYVAGPSHVLPTSGTARFFSPLSVLSFIRFSSIVEMSERGVRELGGHASALARAEGLFEHARSVDLRLGAGTRKNNSKDGS
jgi:histidinol dehydrogenase